MVFTLFARPSSKLDYLTLSLIAYSVRSEEPILLVKASKCTYMP